MHGRTNLNREMVACLTIMFGFPFQSLKTQFGQPIASIWFYVIVSRRFYLPVNNMLLLRFVAWKDKSFVGNPKSNTY